MAKQYVLALYVGGTKAVARFTDLRGNMIGHGVGVGGNHNVVSVDSTISSILNAIKRVTIWEHLGDIFERFESLAAVYVSLSGGENETVRLLVSEALATYLFGDTSEQFRNRIVVEGDYKAALTADVGDGDGIVLIVGTGSIAWGRYDGREVTPVGGWGSKINRPGGARWIGAAGIEFVTEALEAEDSSPLRRNYLVRRIQQELNVRTRGDLLRVLYAEDYNTAQVAHIVSEAAVNPFQDKLAQLILRQAQEEYAANILKVARELGAESLPLRIFVAGNNFMRDNPAFFKIFKDAVVGALPYAQVLLARNEPVKGAVHLALAHYRKLSA